MEAAGRLVIIAVILAACTLYLGGLLERRGRRAS
jgi:hypothetical protein